MSPENPRNFFILTFYGGAAALPNFKAYLTYKCILQTAGAIAIELKDNWGKITGS